MVYVNAKFENQLKIKGLAVKLYVAKSLIIISVYLHSHYQKQSN